MFKYRECEKMEKDGRREVASVLLWTLGEDGRILLKWIINMK
jgi:hypothetical protein